MMGWWGGGVVAWDGMGWHEVGRWYGGMCGIEEGGRWEEMVVGGRLKEDGGWGLARAGVRLTIFGCGIASIFIV